MTKSQKPAGVKITKDDQEAYVLPESVKAYVRNGWTAEDDGSNEEPHHEPKVDAEPARADEAEEV